MRLASIGPKAWCVALCLAARYSTSNTGGLLLRQVVSEKFGACFAKTRFALGVYWLQQSVSGSVPRACPKVGALGEQLPGAGFPPTRAPGEYNP